MVEFYIHLNNYLNTGWNKTINIREKRLKLSDMILITYNYTLSHHRYVCSIQNLLQLLNTKYYFKFFIYIK